MIQVITLSDSQICVEMRKSRVRLMLKKRRIIYSYTPQLD